MTSKRDELLALAERCEKASEGSRELDAEIYKVAIGLGMYETIYDRGGDLCIRDYPGPPGPDYRRLPRFSISLDAAKTLVPERYAASVEWSDIFPGSAWLFPPDNIDGIGHQSSAATPELALCAASLRALVEMEG